jgi:hypothetical protein
MPKSVALQECEFVKQASFRRKGFVNETEAFGYGSESYSAATASAFQTAPSSKA